MQNTKKKLLSSTNLKKYFSVGKESALKKATTFVHANEDITLDIYEGETLGLVGESGCGKSTLGRVLLQLYPQTAGSSMYYGRSLSDLAPKYVEYTLKNARKMVEKYHEAQKKADEMKKNLETLGENATAEQNTATNDAIFAAENALNNVARILGGFIVVPKIEEPVAVLKDYYEETVRLSGAKKKLGDLRLRQQNHPEKYKNDEEELTKQIAAMEQECARKLDKVSQEKKRYADLPDFDKYEAMADTGIDLSRLTYNEIRFLRKDLQIIFQDPYSSLNPRMTIGQIIEEGLVTHKMFRAGSEEAKQYILKVMRDCGLQDYMLHRYPHQFSGGQRQRVCIARALAVNPKFVVCDECVSALDVSIQSQIINLLKDLREKQKLTYLFISHDLSVVKYISDRIGVMYLGSIVELADKKDIFEDPRHPYTVALLSAIPTTDPDSASKDRIILEGNIPSPIHPPAGCKFHTRCYMATEKCRRVTPQLTEIAPNHFVSCHYPEKKIDGQGHYLFDASAITSKQVQRPSGEQAQADAQNGDAQ